jgi:hypothetical protein
MAATAATAGNALLPNSLMSLSGSTRPLYRAQHPHGQKPQALHRAGGICAAL